MSRFTPTETNIRYLPNAGYFGWPPTKGLHKVSAHLIQDFWPPYPASEITPDPTALLQSDGWPRMFWWICGCVEREIPRGGCGQGFEDTLEQ